FHLRRREPALADRGGVVLADGRQAAIEGFLANLFEQDRNAGVGVGHGNAAAHRAGADDRRAPDRNGRRGLRQTGDLARLALAEEDVDESLGLIREETLSEKLPLFLATFGEG